MNIPSPPFDILIALKKNNLLEFYADKYILDVAFMWHKGSSELDAPEYFKLSQKEFTAWAWAVPLTIIARWRYEGWPTECGICNKPLDSEHDKWKAFVQPKEKGKSTIAHADCWFDWFENSGIMNKEDINRNFPLKPFDLLLAVKNGIVSDDEAYKLELEGNALVHEDILRLNEMLYFKMSQKEASALIAPASVKARWRYEGWPTECGICGKPLASDNYCWSVSDSKEEEGGCTLAHLDCMPICFEEERLAGKRKAFPLEPFDLLLELKNKTVTDDYAWDILEEASFIWQDELFELNAQKYFNLSPREIRVWLNGTNPYLIARWRYEGWPAKCGICSKNINYEKEEEWTAFDPEPDDMSKENIIVHNACIPLTSEFFQ